MVEIPVNNHLSLPNNSDKDKKPFFSVDPNDPKVKSIANAFKADSRSCSI